MANLSFDDGDGVWRTIGGRKVFIREGESVSSAMKRSGKFKSAKKKGTKEDHTFKMNDEEKKKYEEVGKKIDDLSKEIDEKNKEKESETNKNEKSNEVVDLVNMGDGKYIPVRKGEKLEDVEKEFNQRQKEYRENLKPHVYDMASGRVAGLWDQDAVDTYIEMYEAGEIGGDDPLMTRDMKNMGGEPLHSPDRRKQNNEMKEINNKIANNKTLTQEEYTKKIREIQSRPSYKQKMDEAVSDLDKKTNSTSSQKYASAKHEGFGDYNKDNIPVYNNKIDYTGDFGRKADLSTLDNNELKEAIRVQTEQLNKAKGERVGDQRTRNGRMDKIFNTARVQQYEEGVKLLKEEETRRSGNQINNALRRKAYQKYLKEHPASKLTFEDFKDMNKMQ